MLKNPLLARWLVAGVALVAVMGCGTEITAPPEELPQLAASGTPNEPWVAQVTGKLMFIGPTFFAERDINGPQLSVKLFSDGSVRGSLGGGRLFIRPTFSEGPVIRFFNLTDAHNARCLDIDGNRFWVGVKDQGILAFNGNDEFVFIFVDNQDGTFDVAGAPVAATDCGTRPGPAFPFTTYSKGTVRITQR